MLDRSKARHPSTHSALADDSCEGLRTAYELGEGVRRTSRAPYERKRGDPRYRPLRIYTADPTTPRLAGAVATVNVVYEPLRPGPIGRLFKVINEDGKHRISYRRADLDDKNVLIRDGYDPSPTDPRFHQQMVYAVCSNVYSAFRRALGRHVGWGYGAQDRRRRLIIRPHAFEDDNAYYDETRVQIDFGYFRAGQKAVGRTIPDSYVFTCLSHDIIAHEVTHALLDGLRAQFNHPSGADVIAFHEAFADLVAIFQHFSYQEAVRIALQETGGAIQDARFLTDLARQFGDATGRKAALRSAIDVKDEQAIPLQYDETLEPHALGSVLVAAVFEAFITIYKRKTARYIRLATNGSSVLPPGRLSQELEDVLSQEASQLADQMLSLCIRAIDYCPPVDLKFGEFLRALITADHDLVPEDTWDYRGAFVDAFRRRDIHPRDVTGLSEDALLWRPTIKSLAPICELSFAKLKFRGDPGCVAGPKELKRQACALGNYVSDPRYMGEFGLVRQGDPRLDGDDVSLPRIESIRSSRRVGPDGQIVFDLVAEVTQKRTVHACNGNPSFDFHGGSTIILDPRGEVRYVISKSVVGAGRLERRRSFLQSPIGQQYWTIDDTGKQVPKQQLFKLLHDVQR